MSEPPEQAIVVKDSTAELIPADATERLVKTLRGFEKVKRDGLRVSDFAIIQGKKHVKKSGCSLLAAICGVSTQKMDERVEDLPNAERLYHFTYRGIAPNGRFADAVGSASTKEKQFTHPHHDARTLAQTRAYNRSILNLVAAGEVSAEEMISETHEETGTSATVESPIPPEVSPASVTEKNETQPTERQPLPSETEISVHKPEKSYLVPLANDFLPEDKKPTGLKQFPAVYGLTQYGMLNQLGNETSIVPKVPVNPDNGYFHWFLEGSINKSGIVKPICDKCNLHYETSLDENKLVKAIVITGGQLDYQHVKQLADGAARTFQILLEDAKAK